MQALIDPTYTVSRWQSRPILASYDSGEECSFYHWVEVCKLVDEADLPIRGEGLEYSSEIERALEETMSEVEPATAYEHFAGHVV